MASVQLPPCDNESGSSDAGTDDSPRRRGRGAYQGGFSPGTVAGLRDCANSGFGAFLFGSGAAPCTKGSKAAGIVLLAGFLYFVTRQKK